MLDSIFSPSHVYFQAYLRILNMIAVFIQYLFEDENSRGERKLIQKLDFFVHFVCCPMYCTVSTTWTARTLLIPISMPREMKLDIGQINLTRFSPSLQWDNNRPSALQHYTR